jgi:hypothetical protein
MGGKLASTKPTLACILQLIMASVLSIADISAILGAFALQRLGVQLFLVWPGLFWVGGTLLLNYRKRGASNKESISGKTEKLKRARNLGIIGSSLAITFAIGLFIYGLVLLSNRVVPDFRLGVLSQYTISLMLVITGLISFAASLQLVNHPKPAGVTIAATSFVQVAWLMLTFLDSGSEKTMGLGLIWILWIPFLYGASYKAIKLSQI